MRRDENSGDDAEYAFATFVHFEHGNRFVFYSPLFPIVLQVNSFSASRILL